MHICGISSVGRAATSNLVGHRFEPGISRHLIMYHYTSQPYKNENLKGFIKHVDSLREKFTIRVEIKSVARHGLLHDDHDEYRKYIISYMNKNVDADKWAIQPFSGYHGLHFVWFSDKADALAVLLKFNGKII